MGTAITDEIVVHSWSSSENKILLFAAVWTVLEIVMLTEVSQTQKNSTVFTCKISKGDFVNVDSGIIILDWGTYINVLITVTKCLTRSSLVKQAVSLNSLCKSKMSWTQILHLNENTQHSVLFWAAWV